MKTKIISKLKKELLIVELPKWYKSFNYQKPLLEVRGDEPNLVEFLSLGRYELLGKPDEIKEEDVLDWIERVFINYKDYSGKNRAFGSPINSFNSALESEIYWDVNPISKQLGFTGNVTEIDKQIALQKQKLRFNEAQEKTFDRNRTLIFVKN